MYLEFGHPPSIVGGVEARSPYKTLNGRAPSELNGELTAPNIPLRIRLCAVPEFGSAGSASAMRSAIKRTGRLDTMSDDLAPAMRAFRSDGVNRALKAVEHMSTAGKKNLECFVVVVSAYFTLSHIFCPPFGNPFVVRSPGKPRAQDGKHDATRTDPHEDNRMWILRDFASLPTCFACSEPA